MGAPVEFRDFSAGLWLPTDPDAETPQARFAVPGNALLTAENVEYLRSGALVGRRGWRVYGGVVGEIRALYRHYPRAGLQQLGPQGASFALDVAGTGDRPWADPLLALRPDTDAASVHLAAREASDVLQLQGFLGLGPRVPDGATIVRVGFQLVRRSTGAVRDHLVRVIRGATTIATLTDPRAVWPTDVFLGSDYRLDARALGLTSDDLNDGAFGIQVACVADGVDQVAELEVVLFTVTWEAPTVPIFLIAADTGANLEYTMTDPTGLVRVPGAIAPPEYQPSPYRPRLVTWPEHNASYVFDGRNATQFFTGQALYPLPQTGALPPRRGPYACLWKDRLFATDPDELDFSVYATAVGDPTNWPAALELACNDPKGGQIGGLAAPEPGDRLVILKENSLWSFVGDIEFGGQLLQYAEEGIVAPDTLAVTPFGIVYHGRRGILLTDGQTAVPLELSGPLRPLFANRDGPRLYPRALGAYFPRRNQYVLRLEPEAPDVWVLQRWEIPTQNGPQAMLAWAHWPDCPATAFGVWPGKGDTGEPFAGTHGGEIRALDVGRLDGAAAIALEIVTAARQLDRQNRAGRAYYVKPLLRTAAPAITVGLRYDFANTDDVTVSFDMDRAVADPPLIRQPRLTITDLAHVGRFLSVRVRDPVSGPQFELHMLDCDIQLRTLRRWP